MPLFKTRFKKSVNGGNDDKTTVTQTSLNGDEATPSVNGEHVNGTVTSPVLGKPVSMLSNGANSLRRDSKELERRQKEVELLVIVKDFTGTNKKEMTVHRGQVVQRMYSCGTWLNIQNVHGLTGYIPTDVSCPKDQVEDSMWCELNREESGGGVYETVMDKPPPKPFPYNSISSNTSTSMSHHSSKSACPETPQGAGPRRVPVRKLSGTPMAVIELSDSPPISYYSTDPVLHPLHPLSITRSHISSDSQTSCSFRENSQDSTVPSTPAVQPLLAHNRNNSYQEAIVDKDKDGGATQVPKLGLRRPSRPSDLPMLPMCTAMGVKRVGQQQRMDPILTSNGTTALHTLETSQASCLVDDVFLPSIQKPIGIYEVLKPYTKQAEGEVTVNRGEYVVAMQMGYGEWALVMTSSNTEGLVPRGHLCRYSNREQRKKVSVGTQTELMIMAPVIHQHSTTSSSSSNTNRDIICIRDIGPDSNRNKKKNRERAPQTGFYRHSSPYYPLDSAWGDSRLSDDLWYENSMSIPQLPQNDSFFTNEAPSICTLPTFNGTNHERGEAPLAFHSSRESLPQFPIKRFGPSLLSKRTVPNENFSSPGSVRRTLREQSDWPMSPGVFSNFSEFSSSPRSPQMIVLKATKDFSPDIDGTDYLSLCKGDILHLIPGNNPYKGWLWVHHIGQRCYGYVPKTHVSYPHDLKHRNNEGTTLYDEV